MTLVIAGAEKNSKNVTVPSLMCMDQEIFEKELGMCRKLHHEKKGCHWGKCATCGVIPSLYKLHKGVVLESEEDIRKVKEEVFGEPI